MQSVALAELAKLLSFQAVWVIFLIFHCCIVTVLALRTR